MPSATKILIAAGGTGGHLYPAVVLARELKSRGCDIHFIVKENRLTSQTLSREKFPYTSLDSAPMVGQSPVRLLKGLLSNLWAVRSSLEILGRERPAAVVGFGAYVSVPMILAARLKRLPILLHEQNPSPGWANRFGSNFAQRVAVSFPETQARFGAKAFLTGNLIRGELWNVEKQSALKSLGLESGRLTLFIFGGSAGAKSINQAIIQSLPQFQALRDSAQFLHLSGSAEQTALLKDAYAKHNLRAAVYDYQEEIGKCYAGADLVVCRAGATTLTELIALGKPSILIPYPFAGEHQKKNAEILTSLQGARLILESDGLAADLSAQILELARRPEKLAEMSRNLSRFPVDLKDSPRLLADAVLSAARPKSI